MLATEILTRDHREATTIVEQLEDIEENSPDGATLFAKLRKALSVHMQAEEEIYYPALAEHEEFAEQVEENVDEHESVKENLAQMSELDPGSPEFQTLLTEIKAALEAHMTVEEDDIFPESLEVLGNERIEELGEQIDQLKGEAGLSRAARP